MRRLLLFAPICTLALFGSAAGASAASESRTAAASWLTQQIHHSVEPWQILAAPDFDTFQDCTITRAQRVPSGAASFSVRCPSHVLPQLVLVDSSVELDIDGTPQVLSSAALRPTQRVPPLVHAGASLQADWRTQSLHAELPVVALDSGVAGGEIRVRIANTDRIMRARILSAHTVTIIAAGA